MGGSMEGVGKRGEGMGKCVGVWGRCRGCEEVWRRYGRMNGVSVEVGGSVWGYLGKCGGSPHTLLHLSPHLPLSPYSSFNTPPPHSPNTSPSHSPDTSLHTFPHSRTLFLTSPTLTSPDTFPTPPPTLPHTHSSHFLTTPTPPPTLPHTFPFTPYQNFSLFSFIAKLVL